MQRNIALCLCAVGLTAPVLHADPGAQAVAELNVSTGRELYTTVVDNTLFFVAGDTSPTGRELYKSDGTPSGTSLLRDINFGSASSDPNWLRVSNGALYFAATNAQTGRELYRSDGTFGGTVLVKDICVPAFGAGGDPSSSPHPLADMNGTLYFAADDSPFGYNPSLWKSDGTESGTSIVVNRGASQMQNFNGTLFFASGGALWKSDGTGAGTVQVKQVVTGMHPSVSPVTFLSPVNGLLLFRGDDGGPNGTELWRSDGTSSGTYMVQNINPNTSNIGTTGSSPRGFMTVGDTILFAASTDLAAGRKLWKTDGTTEAGTQLVKDVSVGAMAEFDERMFFSGGRSGDGLGVELWTSDGTAEGTQRLIDINAGSSHSTPRDFRISEGLLYFTADDGLFGREIWVTDGTADGTRRLTDINPGAASSDPFSLVDYNGVLMFGAFDGVSAKLYAIPEPACLALPLLAGALLARRRPRH